MEESAFKKLLNQPSIEGWSETKKTRWHNMCMRLLRVEEEIEQTDLDYNLLCQHMNLVNQWISTWDDLQRIEHTEV